MTADVSRYGSSEVNKIKESFDFAFMGRVSFIYFSKEGDSSVPDKESLFMSLLIFTFEHRLCKLRPYDGG